MKRRSYLLAGILFGLVSPAVLGTGLPKTSLAGSTHDIASLGCKGCHAPHSGSTKNGVTPGTDSILLWAPSFPAASDTFGVYDSTARGSKSVEITGSALAPSTEVGMYSLLCLSCHDGVTSRFSPAMQTSRQVGSKASFGAVPDESAHPANNHPMRHGVGYYPAKDPSLQPAARVATALPLYGPDNTVQCATCHDAHDNTNTHYLRQANDASHCMTCHR